MQDLNRKNNQILGALAEDCVEKIYKRLDYKIIARNFRNSKGKQMGEIDIIALKNGDIRFIEVKFRRSGTFGQGLEILSRQKIKRITRTAVYFLRKFVACDNYRMHFDFAFVYKATVRPFDKKKLRVKIYADVIDDIQAEV